MKPISKGTIRGSKSTPTVEMKSSQGNGQEPGL